MELKPELVEKIKQLEGKFTATGQDINSYLEGLLHSEYLTYWDYIHLDTLLTMQNPKTAFPDEEIFIMYHQITELYFKMMLHEYDQIAKYDGEKKLEFMISRISRINRYFDNLTHSFDIMVDGMEVNQFLKFRMALLPASGFQSGQYRMIEICSTDFINLVAKDKREEFINKKDATLEELFEHIYWKAGATELATGKKTLTLKQFEEKYSEVLISLAKMYKESNLWRLYKTISEEEQKNEKLINALKLLDINVNINWPLSHYKSAVRYLQKDPEDIKATGGTNWQKYLPPRFQKRIFYPALWSDEEIENWGKKWVEKVVFGQI